MSFIKLLLEHLALGYVTEGLDLEETRLVASQISDGEMSQKSPSFNTSSLGE